LPIRPEERHEDFRAGLLPKLPEQSPATNGRNARPTANEQDMDPSDLPPELDAAMLAFRAVSNGFGDAKATFRNRLIDYIQTTYPTFKAEQVQRIATVANADPTPGRKRRDQE